MRTAKLRPLIDACASQVNLPSWFRGDYFAPGEWLEALILTESGGNPRAIRYEPHQDQPGRADAASDGDEPEHDDALYEDDASYGLCQVMGTNARRLAGVPPGVPMRFGFLLLPITNLAFGLRILTAELQETGGNVERALARYNGGPTGDAIQPGGQMRRAEYVERIAANAGLVKADRTLFGAHPKADA